MTDISRLKSTDFIANFFGITPRRVQQLAQEGKIPFEKVKGDYFFDFAITTKKYISFLQEAIQNRSRGTEEKENDKLDAEIRIKQAKATCEELKLKELNGQLHRSEDVEYITNDLVLTIRSMLTALPARAASDLAEITDEKEIQYLLKEEISSILLKLSNYKYDIKKYQERVKERNKQEFEDDDDEL